MPERHDLVLMKTIRGYEHDLQTIEAIHRGFALDLDVLVDRYEQEMTAVIGDPKRLEGSLLAMIERLFPTEVRRIEQRLKRRTARRKRQR